MTYYKRNGWTLPYAPEFIALQSCYYLSALVYGGYARGFLGSTSSDVDSTTTNALQLTCDILLALCFVGGWIACLFVSVIDPADDAVRWKQSRSSRVAPLSVEPEQQGHVVVGPASTQQAREEPALVHCHKCNVHVHTCSLHCKYCQKCVDRLDHHCFYLNTCVGRRNYRPFCVAIALCAGFFCMCAAALWYTLSVYCTDTARALATGKTVRLRVVCETEMIHTCNAHRTTQCHGSRDASAWQ